MKIGKKKVRLIIVVFMSFIMMSCTSNVHYVIKNNTPNAISLSLSIKDECLIGENKFINVELQSGEEKVIDFN